MVNKNLPEYTESAIEPILPYGDVFHSMILKEISQNVISSLCHEISNILYQFTMPKTSDFACEFLKSSLFNIEHEEDFQNIQICDRIVDNKEFLNHFIQQISDFSVYNGYIVNKMNNLAIPVPPKTPIRKQFISILENKTIEDQKQKITTKYSLLLFSNDLRNTSIGQEKLLNWAKSKINEKN